MRVMGQQIDDLKAENTRLKLRTDSAEDLSSSENLADPPEAQHGDLAGFEGLEGTRSAMSGGEAHQGNPVSAFSSDIHSSIQPDR